jgi:hypothetical protein
MIIEEENCDFKYSFMEACEISYNTGYFMVPETNSTCVVRISALGSFTSDTGYTEDLILDYEDIIAKWSIYIGEYDDMLDEVNEVIKLNPFEKIVKEYIDIKNRLEKGRKKYLDNK